MFKDFLNSQLLPKSQADFVEFGYGQVEPNHLSGQITGQIYAQLPAAPSISILEQGQFVKYDYAANGNGIGEVNFTAADGEWLLVYNEIKLYYDHPDGTKQWDCEFAMKKDNYQARLYSPYDYERPEQEYQARYLNGVDAYGNASITVNSNVVLDKNSDGTFSVTINGDKYDVTASSAAIPVYTFVYNGTTYTNKVRTVVTEPVIFENVAVVYPYDDVTSDTKNIYDYSWTNDPYKKLGIYRPKKMPAGTSMVPRCYKTNIGDIITTNMVNLGETEGTPNTVAIGDKFVPAAGALGKGILTLTASPEAGDMVWKVVRIYTMPDGQKGLKLLRIA